MKDVYDRIIFDKKIYLFWIYLKKKSVEMKDKPVHTWVECKHK